jgi:hypothetical protein
MWMGGDVVTEEQKHQCFFETKTGRTEAEFQMWLHGPQPAWKKSLCNVLVYVMNVVDGLTGAKQKEKEERQKAMRENLERTREYERRQEENRRFWEESTWKVERKWVPSCFYRHTVYNNKV